MFKRGNVSELANDGINMSFRSTNWWEKSPNYERLIFTNDDSKKSMRFLIATWRIRNDKVDNANYYFPMLSFFIAAKYDFVSFITTEESNNMAIRLGMVIKVITISTKCQTISLPQIHPKNTKSPYT